MSEFRDLEVLSFVSKYIIVVDHQRWLAHPLPWRHLEYTAVDVFLISALYTFFFGCSLIPTSLREQSQRYITRFKAYQPRVGLDHESYDTNGFLPLDILDYVEGSASKKLARAADAKWLFSLSERARVIALCAS